MGKTLYEYLQEIILNNLRMCILKVQTNLFRCVILVVREQKIKKIAFVQH